MNCPSNPITELSTSEALPRLLKLGLYGLAKNADLIISKPWLTEVLEIEEAERKRRGLDRRLQNAKLGSYKALADLDWSWPQKLDRQTVDELLTGQFIADGTNVVFTGPSGVGKTTLTKNIAYLAVVKGYSVRFVTASDMLSQLAAQDSTSALSRRLRRFTDPAVLCVDEVGYLSYDSRYADLLFQVVTRRYEAKKPVIITTNKPFSEWADVFPNAACVVTLVDRLLHRCEVIEIHAGSYRHKEATERAEHRAQSRRKR
jgi:DNA replication protein DnaC